MIRDRWHVVAQVPNGPRLYLATERLWWSKRWPDAYPNGEAAWVQPHPEGGDNRIWSGPRDLAERYARRTPWAVHWGRIGESASWPAEIEQATVCACCGRHSFAERLTLALGDPDPALRQYRCEKHWGRVVCDIDGCRRTMAAGNCGHGSNDPAYRTMLICGTHWRMAPKHMRDRHRRLARLTNRHRTIRNLKAEFRAFDLVLQAVRRRLSSEGFIDVAEIERMFGP